MSISFLISSNFISLISLSVFISSSFISCIFISSFIGIKIFSSFESDLIFSNFGSLILFSISILSSIFFMDSLELFEEDELIDGRPMAAGLRRVAELVMGPIVESGPTQVFPPQSDNVPGRATVIWKITSEYVLPFSNLIFQITVARPGTLSL
jgi:hypothetical protein